MVGSFFALPIVFKFLSNWFCGLEVMDIYYKHNHEALYYLSEYKPEERQVVQSVSLGAIEK